MPAALTKSLPVPRGSTPSLATCDAVRESDALALHAHSLSALLDEGEGPAAEARADEHATALRDRLVSIRGSLASVSHDEAGTAADAFLPDEPPEEITPDDLPDLLGDYDVLAHELPVVHAMALALLTAVAEAVEEALGLPPLPDPAEA